LRHCNSPFSEVQILQRIIWEVRVRIILFGKEVLRELKEMEKLVVNGVLIAKSWYRGSLLPIFLIHLKKKKIGFFVFFFTFIGVFKMPPNDIFFIVAAYLKCSPHNDF
jgi:hypothetical protein